MSEPDPIDELGLGLDELVRLVGRAHPEGDALSRLHDAVVVSERLGELGDHLIDHFVDQARHDGASWRAIGASMGVTKQAAQQRFVPGSGADTGRRLFRRFTDRARRSVATAHDEATRTHSTEVGTQHLLLGLLAEGEGLAARAVAALGVSPDEIRQRIAVGGAQHPEPSTGRIPFGQQSKAALKVALREALQRGHNYIGTEHILLGILADTDSAGASVLIGLGVTHDEAAEWLDAALAAIAASRTSDDPET